MKNFFDIVIVGAGVAGSILADKMAETGARVLLLEAGPNEQDRGQLQQNYFAAADKSPTSAYPDNPKAGRPTNPDDYLVQTGPDKFSSSYERRVGGTTWHWHGITPRMVPDDFAMQSKFGVGVDWPISYDDLEPYYLQAEHELGVAGDSEDDHGSPRSGDFPYPALRPSPADKAVAGALKGKSYNRHPLSVKSHRSARNPNVCLGSGSCMPLCPTGAKYEAITHANSAKDKGVFVVHKAVVTTLLVDSEGNISGLRYRTWDRSERRVQGRAFIIAANGMETPRLLLLSELQGQGKVANSSDQVGRNLMDHPLQASFVTTKDPIGFYNGPQSTSVIGSHRNRPDRGQNAGFYMEIFNTGFGTFSGPNFMINQLLDEGKVGTELATTVQERMKRELLILGEVEQLPDPQSRVTLSKDKFDGMDLARPEVHFKIDDYAKGGIEATKKVVEMVGEGLEALNIFHLPFLLGSGHIMGTTRMGNDPKSSVVDKNLRSHDHKNLYITGSSVFPTGTTANPTLTIAALSLRLADHLKKTLQL